MSYKEARFVKKWTCASKDVNPRDERLSLVMTMLMSDPQCVKGPQCGTGQETRRGVGGAYAYMYQPSPSPSSLKCMCVGMCVMCILVHVHVCACVEVEGQLQVSSPGTLSTSFETGSCPLVLTDSQ